MTTAYFLLHSRNVPTRTSSGAKVHWTPIVGTAAIKEATGVVAEDLRKHPLVKTGMIEEISEETYEGLKKKSREALHSLVKARPTVTLRAQDSSPPARKRGCCSF